MVYYDSDIKINVLPSSTFRLYGLEKKVQFSGLFKRHFDSFHQLTWRKCSPVCVFCLYLVNKIILAVTVVRHTDFLLYFLQCIMSNPGTASQKQTKSQNTPRRCSSSTGLDEEVKIAVNLSLERFRYSDQKGNNVFIVLYQKLKAELFSLVVFVKLVIMLHVWMGIVTWGFKQC